MLPRVLGDTWVDRIVLPERLTAGALVPVTVEIGSQKAVMALVELRTGGKTIASKPVALEIGTTTAVLDVTFASPGSQTIEAVVTAPGDNRPTTCLLRGTGAAAPARALRRERDGQREVPAGRARSIRIRRHAPRPERHSREGRRSRAVRRGHSERRGANVGLRRLDESAGRMGRAGRRRPAGRRRQSRVRRGQPPGCRNTSSNGSRPCLRKDGRRAIIVLDSRGAWRIGHGLCKAAAQAASTCWPTALGQRGDLQRRPELGRDPAQRRKIARRSRRGSARSSRRTHADFPAVEQAFLALRTRAHQARHILSDGRSYPTTTRVWSRR